MIRVENVGFVQNAWVFSSDCRKFGGLFPKILECRVGLFFFWGGGSSMVLAVAVTPQIVLGFFQFYSSQELSSKPKLEVLLRTDNNT